MKVYIIVTYDGAGAEVLYDEKNAYSTRKEAENLMKDFPNRSWLRIVELTVKDNAI